MFTDLMDLLTQLEGLEPEVETSESGVILAVRITVPVEIALTVRQAINELKRRDNEVLEGDTN